MKKLLLVLFAFFLTVPVSFSKGESPGLVIKPVYYTNKSPFVLEGFAQAGSEIEICGTGITLKVDDHGKFTVELKVDEGINLFAITATKDGTSTTKGFMVEMDSTPPEVTLLINKLPVHNNVQHITIHDENNCQVTGFTETGCEIVADNNHLINKSIQFEANFSLPKAPSKSDHLLTISDKFGNKTQFEIRIHNLHTKRIIVQADKTKLLVDGDSFEMISPAILVGKMTIMIPARDFATSIFQGTLSYDHTTKKAVIEFEGNKMEFEVDKNEIIYNGSKYVNFGSPTLIKNNRLYMPVELLNRIFNYNYRLNITEKKAEYYKVINP